MEWKGSVPHKGQSKVMLCTHFLSSAMKQAPAPSLSPSKFLLEPPQDPLLLLHFPQSVPALRHATTILFHKVDMPPSLDTPPSPPQVPLPANPYPPRQRGNSPHHPSPPKPAITGMSCMLKLERRSKMSFSEVSGDCKFPDTPER